MKRKQAINLLCKTYYLMANKTGNVMKKLFVEGILVVILLSLITILNFSSCQTTEPPVTQGKIILEALDASSTEAWINVKLQSVNLPAELKLFREDSVTQTITLSGSDTLLYDEGLLPAKTYKYRAIIQSPNQSIIKSGVITVTTMDTTSHDFTWQTYTFGGTGGSSYLKDVAIINENDIWAVGEIHTADTDQFDSNGVWVDPYNAVHWDGNSWELKRIMFYTFCNQANMSSYPAKAVFAFADGKIAIANDASQLTFVVDNIQENVQCLPVSVNAMWGTSSEDFYVVGNNGNIAHYNGSGWSKIESGTELPFQDIWGNGGQILALASSHNYLGRKLYSLHGNTATAISDSGLYYVFGGIWFIANRKYYVVGDGVFEKTSLKSALWYRYPLGVAASYYSNAIRGSEINDIVIAGSYGDISHFNGKSWFEYKKLINTENRLLSVSIKVDIVIAVGYKYTGGIDDYGIIYLGRR